MRYSKIVTALVCIVSVSAYAGTCEIKVTRTACQGKEELSYKKCDGQKSCSEFVDAASADECKTAAVKACENKRLEITKSKVITATYDDKAIPGSDLCQEYANRAREFNQCK